MATRIRLARKGAKKKPFYRIVVADSRSPRDGKFIEALGTYNPMLSKDDQNRVTLNHDRVQEWLKKGAYPSETVAKFIQKAGIKSHLQDKISKKKRWKVIEK